MTPPLMPPASVGDLVEIVEAKDQSLWTRSHNGKLGILLERFDGGGRSSNMCVLLIDGAIRSFHRLDFRVLE